MSFSHRPPETLDEPLAQAPEYYPGQEPEGRTHGPFEAAFYGEPPEPGYEQGSGSFSDEAEPRPSVGVRMGELRGKITRALASFDRGYVQRPSLEAGVPSPGRGEVEETQAFDVLEDVPDSPASAGRFPVGALGYNRAAVDEHVAALERELEDLRSQPVQRDPAISITEEIERLGEQTASILVVAHDQAHETTRLAQEQAERCVTDAADNAVAITEEAKRQLQALDIETDTVWQERARLLEDARTVGTALVALIDEAEARLPEELKPAEVERSHEAQ